MQADVYKAGSPEVARHIGLAHSEADVTGYFRAAGFLDVGLHDFIAGSLGRVTGTKGG